MVGTNAFEFDTKKSTAYSFLDLSIFKQILIKSCTNLVFKNTMTNLNKILKLELRKLAALLISLKLFAAFFLFSLKSPKAIHLPKIKPPKIQAQGKFKRMDPCSFKIRAFF